MFWAQTGKIYCQGYRFRRAVVADGRIQRQLDVSLQQVFEALFLLLFSTSYLGPVLSMISSLPSLCPRELEPRTLITYVTRQHQYLFLVTASNHEVEPGLPWASLLVHTSPSPATGRRMPGFGRDEDAIQNPHRQVGP